MELEFVDEPRSQILIDGLGASADEDVRSPAASRACARADSMPSVTKVNVVSERDSGSRSWCVRTNTGLWNGGSSPHQPRHGSSPHGPRLAGPNLPRPMISAPTLAISCATTAVLAFSSPPSMPWGSRHAFEPDDPVMEVLAALAERVLLGLVRPGHVSVKRDGDVRPDLAHVADLWRDDDCLRTGSVAPTSMTHPTASGRLIQDFRNATRSSGLRRATSRTPALARMPCAPMTSAAHRSRSDGVCGPWKMACGPWRVPGPVTAKASARLSGSKVKTCPSG